MGSKILIVLPGDSLRRDGHMPDNHSGGMLFRANEIDSVLLKGRRSLTVSKAGRSRQQ
jgi:hypothetical protein